MRGFKEKIEWQRKILESVNMKLPPKQQLPGLTQQVVLAWESAHQGQLNSELKSVILRAAELTGSINDFSVPVSMPIEEVREELDRLSHQIATLAISHSY